MEQQEYFMKMQMLGQEAEKIEQQMQAIDQQISELTAVKESIEALNSNKGNEILANLGKGIFTKTEIKSKELLVNVGKEILVKKTPKETVDIIEEQIRRLFAGKEQYMFHIQQLQQNMQNLLIEAQKSEGNSHSHNPGCENKNCECEEKCDDCECERK